MRRTIAALIGGVFLAAGGQALGSGPPVADVGVSAGLGCAAQCITQALVDPTMTGGALHVKTDTPARIKIWVSDQAPGYIDGKPWIPNPDDYLETWEYYTSRSFQLDSLTAGTLYHILVTATDREGRTAYRLGTFKTDDPPPLPPAVQGEDGKRIDVTFYKVKILNDADKGKLNKGEITLTFQVGLGHDYGPLPELHFSGVKKLGSGQTYWPPLVSHTFSSSGEELQLRVAGNELDENGDDYSFATAFVDPANLHDQVWNGDYGGMPYGHDAYVVFETEPRNYLRFRVYAYVDVVDA